MTTPEEPGLISPDEYEIARFVGIPAEQFERLIGALRMAGLCVVPRSLLDRAWQFMPEEKCDCRGDKCRLPHCIACNGEEHAEDPRPVWIEMGKAATKGAQT